MARMDDAEMVALVPQRVKEAIELDAGQGEKRIDSLRS